jgi:hypothetical protein
VLTVENALKSVDDLSDVKRLSGTIMLRHGVNSRVLQFCKRRCQAFWYYDVTY